MNFEDIFDFISINGKRLIKNLMKKGQEFQKIVDETENWDTEMLCEHLENSTSNTIKSNVYSNALKERCLEMDNIELISIFKNMRNRKNIKSCRVIMSIMEERGITKEN